MKALIVFLMLSVGRLALGQISSAAGDAKDQEILKAFLQKQLGSSQTNKQTRYSLAFVDLDGDGKEEAIVYLTAAGWCGSGGCTMLILHARTSSYALVTKTSVTRLPVRVFTSRTNGWFDLGVRVQGGGIQTGYEAVLPFDGRSYATNPTIAPARKLVGKVEGRVVIPASPETKPLF